MFIVATFYHFFDFPHFAETRLPLVQLLTDLRIKGTLLLAPEGINGTVCGTREAVGTALAHLRFEVAGHPFAHKESPCAYQPFARTKVRLKRHIINLGRVVSPARRTGLHATAQEWNRLLDDPDTLVLDARNHYEVHLGSFERAVNPGIRVFSQLPGYVSAHLDPAKHRKIATFCTGGIRCEKLSSWLLEQGYAEVWQLEGGILKYLEDMPKEESKWRGECYVFDGRVAVGHGLEPSASASMCRACGHALTEEDRARAEYKESETCPHCAVKPR